MPVRRSIEVSVDPYEIVLGSPRLDVQARAALDPETARGALSLGAYHAAVKLSGDGRTATVVPDEELPPGPHTLIVEELVSTPRSTASWNCLTGRKAFWGSLSWEGWGWPRWPFTSWNRESQNAETKSSARQCLGFL